MEKRTGGCQSAPWHDRDRLDGWDGDHVYDTIAATGIPSLRYNEYGRQMMVLKATYGETLSLH